MIGQRFSCVLAVTIITATMPTASFANCCCDGVCAVTYSALSAAVTSAVTAASTAIITNDNFLFRDLTGKPVSQVLRDIQGTATMDAATSRKATEQALDAHKNSVVAYNQREQQLEMAREAERLYPMVSDTECSAFAAARTTQEALLNRAEVAASASRTGASLSESIKHPQDALKTYKDDVLKSPLNVTSGVFTRPGCVPLTDASITVFHDQMPVAADWNCEPAKDAPNTIPKSNKEHAEQALSHLVADRNPIPVLPVSQRKTAAGQAYEQQRDIYRQRMALHQDIAADALAKYQATKTLTPEAKVIFENRDIPVPSDGDLSLMDYLEKWIKALWDNPVQMEQMHGETPIMQKLSDDTSLDGMIQNAASRYGVDAALIKAVIHAESGFNPNAKSHVGAQGLMQLMPKTAAWLGVSNPWDPQQNINGGAKYLAFLMRDFNGDMSKAIAAYNAGQGNVRKHKGIPPFAETQKYVPKVLGFYQGYGGTGSPTTAPMVANADGTTSVETGVDGMGQNELAVMAAFHQSQLMETALLNEMLMLAEKTNFLIMNNHAMRLEKHRREELGQLRAKAVTP